MVRCFGLAAAVPTSTIVRPATNQIPMLWCVLIVRSPFRSWTSRRDVHAPPAHEHPEQAEARPDVPVVAARLADVLVRNPRERVALGLQQDLFPEPPVALLALGALARGPVHRGDRRRQAVAHALELAQGE